MSTITAEGIEYAEWRIDGDWLHIEETETAYPYAIRLGSIESITMDEDDRLIITTVNNEYTFEVYNPRGLLRKLGGK